MTVLSPVPVDPDPCRIEAVILVLTEDTTVLFLDLVIA
jgi:hypothetical protein